MKKRVRMLLRVSSSQQLEADGDLTVQRKLVCEYVKRHTEWELDEKEYFEGGVSGYHQGVAERDVLQEALRDAKAGEYEILAVYKDDRIGRRMWEIGAYVMELKSCGVAIYTVKDGCISPDTDDIMGQMMLALRYGNAQKSSSDTGMRVRDTAQKLVECGRFVGGKAPYGYRLELSGEISKHGRALHHLVIVPEQAEVVRYIYELSCRKELGSVKIAAILNAHEAYRKLAPKDYWKGGTITSILTNPVYAGRLAYKRREKIQGKFQRCDPKQWVLASRVNPQIAIIAEECWNETQEKRQRRSQRYAGKSRQQDAAVICSSRGGLALTDVLYCGYCGAKMVNGSRYYYWTIKDTGERRSSRKPAYKCPNAFQGVPHDSSRWYEAVGLEAAVFERMAQHIGKLLEGEEILEEIQKYDRQEEEKKQSAIAKTYEELEKKKKNLEIMENSVADAMAGMYPMSLEELMQVIRKQKEQIRICWEDIRQKEGELWDVCRSERKWEFSGEIMPTWESVFQNADLETKRVLVDRLVKRMEITKQNLKIEYRI